MSGIRFAGKTSMIRIRFHGRGGHGIKTASRIMGTAAFLSGHQAQDSPVYGAERRGAAVVAFTRISDQPILERGIIDDPGLIVLADDTLLENPDAMVLAGEKSASAIFVNSADAGHLIDRYDITSPVIALDITELTLQLLGSAAALSAGLAAAAARIINIIELDQLVAATREEMANLGIDEDLITKNVAVAERVYEALQAVEIQPVGSQATVEVKQVDYSDPILGTPSVLNPGNAIARQTGSWRVERPIIDRDACTRCGLCFVRCPDGAIAEDENGFPVIDYDHCKGCLICRQTCPLHAVESEKETRAW